jgi:hypothetical protein
MENLNQNPNHKNKEKKVSKKENFLRNENQIK